MRISQLWLHVLWCIVVWCGEVWISKPTGEIRGHEASHGRHVGNCGEKHLGLGVRVAVSAFRSLSVYCVAVRATTEVTGVDRRH